MPLQAKEKEMKTSPFNIVKTFEEEMAAYTGAPYAVAVDSCTNAIKLCLLREGVSTLQGIRLISVEIKIPSKTYLSIPMSIIQSGFRPVFDKREETNNWSGEYQLKPSPIWDSARRLRRGMYRPGQFQCLSFHIRKHLPIGKGGMILTDNLEAVEWLKRARYEGRGEMPYKEDDITMIGINAYLTPEQAARGLALLQQLPDHNEDLPEPGGYKDLTEYTIFKKYPVIE